MDGETLTIKNALPYVLNKFNVQGDYNFMAETELAALVAALLEADDAYMTAANVYDGGVYDEDAAFDALLEAANSAFPQYKMYLMRMVEDYMDYAEEYLASIDAIEWE
ncbi:MAG: hypothetical protein Q4B99_06065 [Clostridia bacterium]|nr:hypothetical protein [Clostridia bacterium]